MRKEDIPRDNSTVGALCSLGLHIQGFNQEWIKSIWNLKKNTIKFP